MNAWKPKDVLTDYEEALQKGIEIGLGYVRIHGDTFHFLQACRVHLAAEHGWEKEGGQRLWRFVRFT